MADDRRSEGSSYASASAPLHNYYGEIDNTGNSRNGSSLSSFGGGHNYGGNQSSERSPHHSVSAYRGAGSPSTNSSLVRASKQSSSPSSFGGGHNYGGNTASQRLSRRRSAEGSSHSSGSAYRGAGSPSANNSVVRASEQSLSHSFGGQPNNIGSTSTVEKASSLISSRRGFNYARNASST